MEDNQQSRRNFIANAGKATLAIGLSQTILPAMASRFSGFNHTVAIPYSQQPLPYGYKDLEVAIDAMTMEIHYTKHAATYAKNMAEACVAEKVDTGAVMLEELLGKISKYSGKLRNNAGGHYNHELFWQSMTPKGTGKPSGKLLEDIEKTFGSFDAFKTKFTDAGKSRFGSGWAWLIVDKDHKLVVGSTPNQDNPLMDISELKGTPLLGLDVWEHAYYLRYHNLRPDYITNWWKVVNWEVVQKRYESA